MRYLSRALQAVSAVMWLAFLTLALRDLLAAQLYIEAAFMLFGFWVWVGRDIWSSWTGFYYSVIATIDGNIYLAERCAFEWSAKRLAKSWARKYRYVGIPGKGLGETRRIITVATSRIDDAV